jgi:hypothetical protein
MSFAWLMEKANVIYPMLFGFQAAATYQNLSGIQVLANNTFRNAAIAPALGQNLSSGSSGYATIPVLEPNTVFEDHLKQMALWFSKRFSMGRASIQAQFDVYNIFSTGTIPCRKHHIQFEVVEPTLDSRAADLQGRHGDRFIV